ncbi:HAD family hydrolase [Arhodomonas sp. AD133]|uniref:histidinol-phosphatase n=1 Tax=Arhodomonas sp. AD133 TaxID=3415009 RepID=UPI003EBFF034
MTLTIFDLDNTLIAGDSDHLWGEFLVERGIVDGATYAAENQRFFEDYTTGRLDIDEFLAFSLRPLADNAPADLSRWRAEFVAEKIAPIILPAAVELIASHRARGDHLMIITATNRFVTAPIAEHFGIDCLLATEPEFRGGRYTGRYVGTPTFRMGKIDALETWKHEHGESPATTVFYSDSHNDVPLLERVDEPVAVDPDPTLAATARARGWRRISLRRGDTPQPLD